MVTSIYSTENSIRVLSTTRKKKLSYYSFSVPLHKSITNLIYIVFHNYIMLVSNKTFCVPL